MKMHRLLIILALLAAIVASCGKKASEEAPAPVAEKAPAKVSSHLVKAWMLGLAKRAPGINAKKGVALDERALGVRATPNAVAWFEMVDIDSNGTQEKIGFMWDATAKVMYAYTYDPVMLDDGSVADKGLIVAQFADGNAANRPQGSGYWAYATTRDTLSYRLVEGSLYGCRFDPMGEETECGPGTWNRDNNNFSIKTSVR
jgi:hypothetical protein